MIEERSFQLRSSLAWVAALLAVPLACALWWLLREPPVPELPGPGLHARRAPAVSAVPAAVSVRATLATSVAERAVNGDTLPDGIRIANDSEPHEPGMVPHPITPQHQRIFRENRLIGQLNGAMDVKDAPGLRELLKRYRDEYPEDAHVLQDGYELIANCIERPGTETRGVAQRYYDEQLDSGLRRYIRRHCLEN